MRVRQLIEALNAIEDKEKEVLVWEGYDAGHMTTDFEVNEDDELGVIHLE